MALNKTISISKFDVDPEGENLQLIIDCPVGYEFTSFYIYVYNELTNDIQSPNSYDFSSAILDGNEGATHYSVLIPLKFNTYGNGVVIPSMYRLTASVQAVGVFDENGNELINAANLDPIDDAEAWTSDLRHVFDCMTASILNSDPCKGLPDEVIRQEVLLQGHLFALKNVKVEEALQYFKAIQNCGHNCGNVKLNPCNCGQK